MYWKQLFGLSVLLLVAVECQKLNVKVYYESLCPDSRQFINTQLAPIAKDYLQYMDLQLIPYGKSTHNTQGADTIFECHHGPNECYGNKIHACVVINVQSDSFRTETREVLVVQYVDCLMALSTQDSAFPIEHCATHIQYKNWENILNCANSTIGSKLLQQFGEQTQTFQNPLQGVPTIVFNDKYDMETQKRAFTDFRSVLCEKLMKDNIKAKECQGVGAGNHLTGFGIVTTLLTTAVAFLY